MGSPSARAQLVTEIIDLQAGWNAVWFNVQPETSDVVQFLSQQAPPLNCQAIWTFDSNRDVRTSLTNPGRWFFYNKDVPPILHTLKTLHGHRAYLILVNVAGQMQVTGRPVIRETSFNGRVSNLFGTATNLDKGPLTFEEFFSHPSARGKVRSFGIPVKHDIFSVSGQTLTRRNVTDAIGTNQAYWVNVVQDFDYAGPLDVMSMANGLSFGQSTALRTLTIEVPSSPSSRTVFLQAKPCITLSGGACAPRGAGGEPWLEYLEPGSGIPPVWHPLSDGLEVTVPPDVTRIDLTVRAHRAGAVVAARSNRGPVEPPPLVIDIVDDEGSRAVIAADVTLEPIFGRWVGRARLAQVSTHPIIQNAPLEESEAVPMEMTLLLDLPSGAGAARLLDTVTIETFRDGRPLQRRFTSVLFDRPVNLTEDAGDPVDSFGLSGTLHGTLHILPEDPLNPYRHRYNPEHRKGYDITRQITIQLQPLPPTAADEAEGLDGALGPQRLTGLYTEVITGVLHDAITVQGTFQLERLIGDPVSLAQ
jgi:hypothetical protein